MAQYQNLQATIDAQIKANGIQSITGPVLNAVLNSMVNVLGDGYRFRGIASPADNPGTPDNRVYYIAASAGTYANFGGVVVPDDGYIYIITFDAAWAVVKTEMAAKSYVDDVFAQSPFRAGAGAGSAVLTAGANLAPGKQAVGMGSQARANGDYSLVYGAACKADGKRGHAGGYGSQAPAENAVALGDHVEATAKDEAAFGRYNRHNPDLYSLLFSVGMGTSADRRNAMQIDDDGKMFVRGVGGYDGGITLPADGRPFEGTAGISLQDLLCYELRGAQTEWPNVGEITEHTVNELQCVMGIRDDYFHVFPRLSLYDFTHASGLRDGLISLVNEMGGDPVSIIIYAVFGSVYAEGVGFSTDGHFLTNSANVVVVWQDPDLDNRCFFTTLEY